MPGTAYITEADPATKVIMVEVRDDRGGKLMKLQDPKYKRHRYGTTGTWWPCEVRALKSMRADGYSTIKMAEVLDRSFVGTQKKSNRTPA